MSERKFPPMDEEAKECWLQALRSGRYTQGAGALCRITNEGGRNYCCLGVLAAETGLMEMTRPERMGYGNNTSYLPEGEASLPANIGVQGILARMNDNGSTFDEIADWIEENL